MDADYPEHLLAREPAPPYEGEGPFALWHFSEDHSLGWFRPHTPATNADAPPLVWAVDTRHAPMFWFPRDCPRGCIWPVHGVGGYWVADEPVEAIERVVIDDLVGRHAAAGIELRVTPSIWPFWRRVVNSTVEFSGSRLGNSTPHPDRFG